MSSTDVDNTATTTLLLSPASDRRRFSRRSTVRGAVSFLRRANSRQMISEQSVRVRESAAQQIEERQSDWAYSTPIVILDLIWNTAFVLSAITVMILSKDENTEVPLRLWLVGYGVQCVLHMSCVCVEYRRRREVSGGARVGSSVASSLGIGLSSGSNLNLNVNSGSNSVSYANLSSNLGSNPSSSASVDAGFAEFVSDQRQDEDNTSVAKHLESANTMFSFIWWIIGFYWVSSGGEMLSDNAPKLYWLTITFLAFDVFFVVICVIVACIIGIAVCCCLPCIIAILYAVADQEGATKEDIERLPKYKFRRLGEIEKPSGEIQESFGGIMTECDTDTPIERALSAEDAVNPHTLQVKLCDFGSAKMLVPGEPNISYICSRYYRAPELIFGATEYTTAIDMWSVGCVMAELLHGQPLFPGESGVDQLVEIIKILGTPTREEIRCMNPNYSEFKFPQIKAHPWHKVFHKRMPPEAVDLVSRLLQYSPNLRCTALEACAHQFFDNLREPNACLPNGKPFPPLFNFTPQELAHVTPELRARLVPEHMK